MPKKFVFILSGISLLLTVASCKKIDSLQPDILAPLIKSTAKVEDIGQIRDKHFTQEFPAASIGSYPVGVLLASVAPIEIDHVGPYPYTLSDTVTFVDIDTMNFSLTFSNSYPISVQAGTQVVFRSSSDVNSTANIIFAHIISHDIAPNTSYTIDTIITNKYLPATIYMSLDTFRSQGGNNVTFSSQPSVLDFEIRLLSTFTVGVKTNITLGVQDTTDVQFSGDQNNYNDSTVTGIVSIYISNSLPINLHFGLDFYDDNYNYLTSLYQSDMVAVGGTTDVQGNPTSVAVEQRFDDTLSIVRINQIRSATHAVYRVTGDTNGYSGTEVVVGKNCALNIQIVGDLQINISKLF